MTQYTERWDLTTIPEPEFNSEAGRRRRAKGPARTNVKLEPCPGCGEQLTASQRRSACPNCDHRGKRV